MSDGRRRLARPLGFGVLGLVGVLSASACGLLGAQGKVVGAKDNSVWPVAACQLYPLQDAVNAVPQPLSEAAFARSLGIASALKPGAKVELSYITKEAQRAAVRKVFVDMDGAMTTVQGTVELGKNGKEFVKLDEPLPALDTLAWAGYYDPYSVGRLHFPSAPASGAGVAFSTGCVVAPSEISLQITSTVPPTPPAS